MSVLRAASATATALILALVIAGPAHATSPVEHGTFNGVDPTFSGFLTQSCGFPVTVTDHESDTFIDNRGLFIESVHITADVVGNGRHITLGTNSPLIIRTDGVSLTVGQIVQVRDAADRLLAQLTGQLRIDQDGNGVFHGHFPMFDLCDFLR